MTFFSCLRKITLFLCLCLSFEKEALAEAQKPVTSPLAANIPSSFADVVEPLLPAVVNISSTTLTRGKADHNQFFDVPYPKGSPLEDLFKDFLDRVQPEGPRNVTALGSGFIIDSKGYIVTNNHVVADADQITVILNDNTELKATLVGRDRRTDIAVLKVKTDKTLPFVEWGNSEKLRAGDWVIAIGNPFGLGGTVTAGIVSHVARNISENLRTSDFIEGYIQTDASINLGNSGGPMFDVGGRVVGVNTSFFSPTGNSVGIGFAIPSEITRKIVDQIIQYGKPRRGWLGVHIQPVTSDIAEGLGLKELKGALVGNVVRGGPAAKGKLQSGDVILKVGTVDIKDEKSLPRIVGNVPVGSQIKVTIWRKGKNFTFPIVVGEYEESEEVAVISSPDSGKDVPKGIEVHGMTLQPLTKDIRQRFDIAKDVEGVLIVDVIQKSSAAEKGLRPSDIIVEIGQSEVKTPQHVLDHLKKAEKAKRKSVLLLIDRDGESRYISLKLSGDAEKQQ
jgi:serine protease Do